LYAAKVPHFYFALALLVSPALLNMVRISEINIMPDMQKFQWPESLRISDHHVQVFPRKATLKKTATAA